MRHREGHERVGRGELLPGVVRAALRVAHAEVVLVQREGLERDSKMRNSRYGE